MYVTYTGRKTLSYSQLDTISLSPVFHSCFLKGTSLLCRCHPSCVVWTFNPGSTIHIFRPSYAEFGNFILRWLLNAFTWKKYPVILGPEKTELLRKLRLYSICLLHIFMKLFWHFCMNEVPANKLLMLCFCLMGYFEFYLIFRTVYRILYLFALNQSRIWGYELSGMLSCVTVEMVHDMSQDWTLEDEGNLVLQNGGNH